MNYKLLLPSYRTRQQYLECYLRTLTGERPVPVALNVGCGEGELDAMIAPEVGHLDACDINADDVASAASLNRDIPNIRYSVADATRLDYAQERFDLVVALEVIEHVQDPAAMLAETCRVLKPGGHAVLTTPNRNFPVTYDPVNALLGIVGRHLPIGAYAFGHRHLCTPDELRRSAERAGLRVAALSHLSGYLTGACECYVPGILQKVFKPNRHNSAQRYPPVPGSEYRNRRTHPAALRLTDGIVALDRRVSESSGRSIGLALSLVKPGQSA